MLPHRGFESHIGFASTVLVVGVALYAAFRPAVSTEPTVHVIDSAYGFQLIRNGHRYFVNGAGGDGSRETLARSGGNSVRIWHTGRLQAELDEAERLGLTVTVGFWMAHERQGFDYDDPKQVVAQAIEVRASVEKFKHHPSVLIWALGNEMEGNGENAAGWLAVNRLAGSIKKLDPNHPTMTVVADIRGDKVKQFHRLCPKDS